MSCKLYISVMALCTDKPLNSVMIDTDKTLSEVKSSIDAKEYWYSRIFMDLKVDKDILNGYGITIQCTLVDIKSDTFEMFKLHTYLEVEKL